MSTTANFLPIWDAALHRGFLIVADEVRYAGLDHGALSIIGMHEIEGLGTVLTVHEAGRNYWASRGTQGYAGATISTLLVQYHGDRRFRYVRLSQVDAKSSAPERSEYTAFYSQRLLQDV